MAGWPDSEATADGPDDGLLGNTRRQGRCGRIVDVCDSLTQVSS